MNELLVLLKEAYDQIHEMWKVADDSVADYILDLEIAMDFVKRALDTEDRLDIFKALQKAHDVLEREEESSEDEEQDGYDNLVDRLKAALDGLNENVIMKESELRALIKAVLTEIYQEPQPEERGILGFFSSIADKLKQGRPELTDIQKGHVMAHKLVAAMIADIKTIVKGALRKKDKEISKGVDDFHYHSSSLIGFMVNWAQEIDSHNKGENRDEMSKPMNDLKDHLNQIGAQFSAVFGSIKDKTDSGQPNMINALKQFEHLNEIFARLKASVDDVFEIGVKSGYGKTK